MYLHYRLSIHLFHLQPSEKYIVVFKVIIFSYLSYIKIKHKHEAMYVFIFTQYYIYLYFTCMQCHHKHHNFYKVFQAVQDKVHTKNNSNTNKISYMYFPSLMYISFPKTLSSEMLL